MPPATQPSAVGSPAVSRAWKVCAVAAAFGAVAVTGCSAGSPTDASSPATGAPSASSVVVTATVAPFGPRSIIIIGDSISVGSEDEYHDEMPLDDVEVVATSGIRLRGQRKEITKAVAARPDVLVIELGTNDAPMGEPKFLDEIDAVLTETSTLPCVRWVTVYAPKLEDEVKAINDHLREAAETHPNLELVDWFQMVQDDPDLLSEDGLHPNDAGQRALAKAVATATATCG